MCCMAPAITCRCWGWGKHEVRCGGGRRSVTTVGEIILSDETGFPWNKAKLVESGVRHLRPFNISNDGQLDLAQTYFVPVEAATEAKASLVAGDVLFNNTNSVELVGKTAVVREPMAVAFSNHINRLRVRDVGRIEPRWLALALRNLQEQGVFAAHCNRWIGQAGFSVTELAHVDIPIPYPDDPALSLAEQRRIVARLEALLGEVEKARQLTKAMMREIEETESSVLSYAFLGEL